MSAKNGLGFTFVLLSGVALSGGCDMSSTGLAQVEETPAPSEQAVVAEAKASTTRGVDMTETVASPPATSAASEPTATPADADGTIPFAFEAPAQPSETPPSECALPMPATGKPAKVFAAGAYGGRDLGFQIDQSGNEAGRIDVAVNHPDAPVVLMLGSYDPTIWHVGWSRGTRVAAVLVGGYHRQVVTGLPKDVPVLISTYDNKGPCGYFYVSAERAGTLNPIARRAFGRPVDMVYLAQQGRVLVGDSLGDAGGLITDAGARRDESFRIADAQLAGEAGLAYAVSQGWLRKASQADANAWLAAHGAQAKADIPPIAGGRPAGRISLHNGYVVLKAFTLPEGLYGAHSGTFFVPKGVSRPRGTLGHSTLYDFNTLTCTGTGCERD
jgi:hypothetical protein